MSALPSTATPTTTEIEFDRQVDALVQAGVPDLLDTRVECFRAMVDPLRDVLPSAGDGDLAGIPFAVVVPHVPVTELLAAVHTAGGTGRTGMAPEELRALRPAPEISLPTTPYLVLGVDPGAGSQDVAPAEAATRIAAQGRFPLTVAEGLAVLVSDCGLLRAGASFALLGSRAGGTDDRRRVPALWTSGERPTLAWWDASVAHPGLGSASCRARLAA